MQPEESFNPPDQLLPSLDMRRLYRRFNSPLADLDCGRKCAPYNPNGKPFCCDICHAVPVAYRQEWDYLQRNTDLWHLWRGDECPGDPGDPQALRDQAPDHLEFVACLGPDRCQRDFRAMSCRQFPFFPYITTKDRFIGLAYEWEFENSCWVISNLGLVSETYRSEFVAVYDEIFAAWEEEFDSYAALSEMMREHFAARRRRIPLLHRNGGAYLLSPGSERLQPTPLERLPRFGPYR